MVINFSIYHQTLSVAYYSPVISRSQDYLQARFTFSCDWNNVQKIAQFVRDDLKYNILLDGDSCFVPWELLKTSGTFTVTVWGNNYPDEENIVITTNKLAITIQKDGLDDDILPTDPTQGLDGSLLTRCEEAADAAEQSAIAAEQSAEQAAESVQLLQNVPHFEFDSNGYLYLIYNQ